MVRRYPPFPHGRARASPRTLRVALPAACRGRGSLRGRRVMSARGGRHRALGVFGMPYTLECVSDAGPCHGQSIRTPVRHRCRAGRSSTARRFPSREPVVRDADPQRSPVDSGRGDLEGHTPHATARIGPHSPSDGGRRRLAGERRYRLVGVLVGVGRRLRLDGRGVSPTSSGSDGCFPLASPVGEPHPAGAGRACHRARF